MICQLQTVHSHVVPHTDNCNLTINHLKIHGMLTICCMCVVIGLVLSKVNLHFSKCFLYLAFY
jgi:hypothetical protein